MKVEFFTLGCKVNTYETEAMKALFIDRGYEVIDNDKKNSKEKKEISDIYVINTCSVTNIAEKKSRQYIRRAKELNPKAIIIACGCYAQVAKNDIEKINGVDIILGNNEKTNIVDIIEKYIGKKETIVSDVMHQNDYLDFKNTEITKLNRADVKVQDGCDRFCSYCIIPYARGKVRSREPESILKEIKDLVGKGIKEIVVTGIECLAYRSSDKTYIPVPFISMVNSNIGLNTKVNSNILYLLIETTIDRSNFSGWAEIRFVYE